MLIRCHNIDGFLEMRIEGRLDGYWSQQLAGEMERTIERGQRHIRLNLSEVDYISSAAIQVLLRFHQQLNGPDGAFTVTNPSDQVRKVLSLSGLSALFATPERPAARPRTTIFNLGSTHIEADVAKGSKLLCRVHDPDRARSRSKISCWKDVLALGNGALSEDATSDQFGACLAVGGAAICLPRDRRNTLDYMLTAGAFVPDVSLHSGIVCEGELSARATFDGEAGVGLLAAGALEILGADLAALSITGENEGGKTMLVVGVAARKSSSVLGPLLEPLTNGPWPKGRFFAVTLPHVPRTKHKPTLQDEVASLLATNLPEQMLCENVPMLKMLTGCFFAGSISEVVSEADAYAARTAWR